MTLEAIVRWFETLTRETATRVEDYYAADASFKDPFNEVRGTEAIRRVYVHMFDQVADPRFEVRERWASDAGAMLTWDFTFRMAGGRGATVRGVTHLRFAPDGRISFHRDYWDAAEELYEKLPGLGALMRFLKRRLRA